MDVLEGARRSVVGRGTTALNVVSSERARGGRGRRAAVCSLAQEYGEASRKSCLPEAEAAGAGAFIAVL
eukprot:scaffold112660_cov29-Tisochrysis_lutea.AAC.2